MNHKRSAEDVSFSSLLRSPYKRRRHDSTASESFPPVPPQTPAASSNSGLASSSSPSKFTQFATPRTPYTPYPLRASDSPSNPFGRKRKERLVHSLPPISSFSKHIALRFQFVRRGVSPRQGGVYRIVRVPKNYTFTHLRSLIAWLFDTPARYANGKACEEEYLFEVKNKTVLYSPLYKPGQVKSGVTTVKLSNVRDPGRWPSGHGFGSEEDELSEEEGEEEDELDEQGSQLEAEGADEEWKWVDEEDFTLGHAWPMGLDPLISIIYHHSLGTQVHISVNTTKLARQRGISNTPYVFSARGRVHLSPPPLPRPLFTKSILDTLSSSPAGPSTRVSNRPSNAHRLPPPKSARKRTADELTDNDADGDTDIETQPFTTNHPFFRSQQHVSASPTKKQRREDTAILVEDSDAEDDEDEDPTEENHEIMPDIKRWNEPQYAFALYLLQFMDPLGFPFDGIDESFFAEDKVYDPFEDDDSDDGLLKKKPLKIQKTPGVQKTQKVKLEEEEYQWEEYEEGGEEQEEEADIDLAASEREDEAGEDVEAEYEDDEAEYDYDEHQYTLGSTPGLTNCPSSSSPRFSPSIFPFASSSLPDPSELPIILAEHYPNTKYTKTPAPPRAKKHRLRITRLEKRLAKIKKTDFLCKYDEVEEPPVVEVDELEEEEDEKWVPPVLKEGEVWDPFGDEEEL